MSVHWENISAPGTGLRRRIGFDNTTNEIITEVKQPNMREVLEMNNDLRNADRESSSLWGDNTMVRIAQIPLWLLEKWQKEEGINFYRMNDEDKAKVNCKMNDPDYAYLRTAPGRI